MDRQAIRARDAIAATVVIRDFKPYDFQSDCPCGEKPAVTTATGSKLRPLLGLRLLIVEDTWLVADTLAVHLEAAGARVQGPFASNARAMAFLEKQPVDFALVDLNLTDGFADQVIEALIARGIPYAVLTGYRALPTNVDEHAVASLKKPFDMTELIDILARHAIAGPNVGTTRR